MIRTLTQYDTAQNPKAILDFMESELSTIAIGRSSVLMTRKKSEKIYRIKIILEVKELTTSAIR
jgi:hypothetical protein